MPHIRKRWKIPGYIWPPLDDKRATPKAIKAHKRAHRTVINRKEWSARWWFARFDIFILLLGRREARCFQMLISSEPSSAREATDKLLYLSAVLIAEGRALSPRDAEIAVGTLKPYRDELNHGLFQMKPRRK